MLGLIRPNNLKVFFNVRAHLLFLLLVVLD